MAGIYIHVPFCRRKCHYCNFFSTPSGKYREAFVPALLKEIELQKTYLEEEVATIYSGGGTPSMLSADEINHIIDAVYQFFRVAAMPEISLEVNPDDINAQKIKALRSTIVNRMSVGVQSFFAKDLKYLNRIHDEASSEYSIKALQDAGYNNISIDLIYGIPTLDMESWKENLQKVLQFQIPHLSAYALTVESNTSLEVLIHKSKLPPVSEAEIIDQFTYLMDFMKDAGFLHYEISNFCLTGYESKHNSAYWDATPYLGVGPSAHSFNKTSRQWNVSLLEKYIESIEKQIIPCESEQLTPEKQYNEYILTGLRTNKGINTGFVENTFGSTYVDNLMQSLKKYADKDWLILSDNTVCLTSQGKLFADMISADLFVNE